MKRNIYRRIVLPVLVFTLIFSLNVFQVNGLSLTGSDIPGVTDIENRGTLPEITAASAVLIDASTGQILYEKNAHEKRYPASTTKIMTALLAVENLKMDDTVTVDAEAASMTGSRIYLSEGEYIFVKDLLYSLMIASANDSAVALGKAVAGSVSEFAEMMNDKARQCGALNTHFNNTNGLPDEQHYTTAYDLAMITKAAFAHQTFRDVVATAEYKIAPTNKYGERNLVNGNRMLWDEKPRYDYNGTQIAPKYEGTNGVKTGFTEAAGSCLAASVNRDGHELIGVVMGSERDMHFFDMIKVMDYGFDNYDRLTVCSAGDFKYSVKVKKSEVKTIDAGIAEDINITLPAGSDTEKITTEVSLDKKFEAPLEQNQAIGALTVYYDGSLLCTADIIALQEAPLRQGPDIAGIAKTVLKIIGAAAVILLILVLAVNIVYRRKKKKKRR
ncbi:MAG: D-alanyl-D-alanine carboxypeptidase family protein [Bacillota bacterium]|nr:D-alanyl-D-alanine carboxypeptidase family protein [Bacillota bacterium]